MKKNVSIKFYQCLANLYTVDYITHFFIIIITAMTIYLHLMMPVNLGCSIRNTKGEFDPEQSNYIRTNTEV